MPAHAQTPPQIEAVRPQAPAPSDPADFWATWNDRLEALVLPAGSGSRPPQIDDSAHDWWRMRATATWEPPPAVAGLFATFSADESAPFLSGRLRTQ